VPEHDWDEHYRQGHMPWDIDTPDQELVDFVCGSRRARGRALDICWGTGTHALWLAARGFHVVGVDISPRAIGRARARVAEAHLTGTIRFVVADFFAFAEAGPFDLVFDRGVFHVFDAIDDRARFAAQVARCLAPSGQWLSLIGSTEGPPRHEGPPRRSARDVTIAVEPALEIVELRSTVFDRDQPVQPRAWLCVARHRDVPAQPSAPDRQGL